jgi:hypothetical protein
LWNRKRRIDARFSEGIMKFILNDAKVRAACVEHILNVDVSKKPIFQVSIMPYKKSRSNPQNSYLWGVVYKTISNETGYTCDELHELFKSSFLPHKLITIGDKSVKITPSTTELTTIEFEEFLELVKRYAAETIGIFIPDPNAPLC